MKAIKLFLLLLFPLLFIGCDNDDDQPVTPIGEVADKEFMSHLLSFFDLNKDGIISTEEALVVKEITLPAYSEITSLSGIENFPALEVLDCSRTPITTLDISQNKNLKVLICSFNEYISTLDISQNEWLEEVNIDYSTIADLNFSEHTQLKKLSCQGTHITALDISQLAIEELNCSHSSHLKSLNAKGNQSLKKLICEGSSLLTLDAGESAIEEFVFYAGNWNTTIFLNNCVNLKEIEHLCIDPKYQYVYYFEGNLQFNLSGCTSLTKFRSNLIGQLDITNCPSLKDLECIGTFQSLEIDNKALERIYLHSPNLKSMDISACSQLKELSCCGIFEDLDLTHNTDLERLTCIAGYLPGLDVSPLSNLKYLEYGFYKTDAPLDLKKNSALEELVVRDTLIDAYHDRKLAILLEDLPSLKKLNINSRFVKEINASGCSNLEEIRIENTSYYLSILSALNIEGCTALKNLYCTRSSLELLDVSHCLQLDTLYINDGLLTSLKVNDRLQYLNCSVNALTSLDLADNARLTGLDCSNNQIHNLKINGCSNLTDLYCYANKIKVLDLDGCSALQELNCSSNEITSLSLDLCIALDKLYCEMNQLTELDVSKNRALTELACSDNPQLLSLYIYRNHTISQLQKDNQTTIILKD
ncbi:hypothetical protein [Parabacteroides sp. PF5-6]|uniref:leucine-rich repeat domain-containing protein n=1 Tax=Parabacteroides sp. PF5-6 TaxID=1742403 RepID=UPI002406647F|nr:hypothetical protein [Parabacteroides sp. PF5-6]MDF9829760.1 Leucine-rich repeat (LRR) protein [Parabacteroides sp. PF5-6]